MNSKFLKKIFRPTANICVINTKQFHKPTSMEATLNFGKYKGTKVSEMVSPEQVSYLEWVVNGDAVYPDIANKIRFHLRKVYSDNNRQANNDRVQGGIKNAPHKKPKKYS